MGNIPIRRNLPIGYSSLLPPSWVIGIKGLKKVINWIEYVMKNLGMEVLDFHEKRFEWRARIWEYDFSSFSEFMVSLFEDVDRSTDDHQLYVVRIKNL